MTFHEEQRALAAQCWQLVGITDDFTDDDAWLRRTLFGIDVFVQRFGEDLRGFRNVCAHRGFPLRVAERGTGPVKCGFHAWGYNKDGVPTSIPRNAELFGLSREQREALALPGVRVETVGRFVFASLSPTAPAVADYLGPYADVYRATSANLGEPLAYGSEEMDADWKRHAEITLDDYHLGNVHASTFGATGELAPHQVVYRRDGLHSCYLKRRDPDWSFDGFWRDVPNGVMDRTGYKIFNAYPGLVLATTRDVCIASATYALSVSRARVDTYLIGWREAPPASPQAAREIVDYFETIAREDREACERWQLGQPSRAVLGKLEERVAWFREAHAQIMARGAAAG